MTLPQNVKDAVRSIDDSETVAATPHPDCNALVKIISVDDWQIISAHLLSQDAEIERLQSGLAAADAMLETTERTLERCKQTLDTTSEGWRLDAERLEAAEMDASRYRWLRDSASKDDWDKMAFGCITDYQLDAYIDAATQESEG